MSAWTERLVAAIDVGSVAVWFAAAGHVGWGLAILIAGIATSPALALWLASVPVTPLQVLWLAGGALVAVQFASTGVGPESGSIVWGVSYATWLFYRAQTRARERQAATLTPSSIAQADPTSWPVILEYGSGRTAAFRIAFAFFALAFVTSAWLVISERSSPREGLWVALSIGHLLVLGALLVAASQAAKRIALFPDRIEVAWMLGRSRVVSWAEVVEVRIVRWAPQGIRPPQLHLVDLLGRVTLALDLGDLRQRSLLPYVRRRLMSASWRAERRTSWL